MAEFFAFYWSGILKFLNWFIDPVHLFGLFVVGFFVVSFVGFFASMGSNPYSLSSQVFGILFLVSFGIFVLLGVPFFIFLSQ